MPSALSEIWWSANSDSAITYRQRVGLFTRPSVGVVVQVLVDPETAGVMFTQNPITGADERVIEASWGLGEAVVAGRVIPDHFRVDRSGAILERVAGRKSIVFRSLSDGGTVEEEVPARPRRAAVPRRPRARRAGRTRGPLHRGLRAGPGRRVGVRRRDPLPAPVPRRDAGGRMTRRRAPGMRRAVTGPRCAATPVAA